MSDLDFEPIPGLPTELPPGESIVWQGRPAWRALARQTFKTRWLAAYFAVLVGLRAISAFRGEQGAGFSGLGVALLLAVGCLAVVHLLAFFYARSSVYTITTHRIVMRIGIAIPMTWNLPFKQLASADVAVRKEGDGDIVLRITEPNRIAWLHLWPHVAPKNVVRARPALRAIAEPARVAALLAEAVKAWAAASDVAIRVAKHEAPAAPVPVRAPRPALAEAGQ